MIPEKIEKYIVKYVSKSATSKDLDKLIKWIENPNNKLLFKDYLKDHYAIMFSINDPDAKEVTRKVLDEIRTEKNRMRRNRFVKGFKYAAVAVLFIAVGYFMQLDGDKPQMDTLKPEKKITLQLEDGTVKIIDENQTTEILGANGQVMGLQTGKQLSYDNSVSVDKLVYNTLTVPFGKRFNLVLSDGTNVHLNAGTSLKYPVKFINGLDRKVFINGEAYFDVVKDKKHPFIVNADELDIRVLGTQFNISSYPEDKHINTVLVEGSVSIFDAQENDGNEPQVLKPEQLGSWSKTNKQITVSKTDIEQHVAWREGRLVLDEVPFNDILKKLERQYDVTFSNAFTALESREFTARFDVEDIHQVMRSLSEAAAFTYTINNKQILINP